MLLNDLYLKYDSLTEFHLLLGHPNSDRIKKNAFMVPSHWVRSANNGATPFFKFFFYWTGRLADWVAMPICLSVILRSYYNICGVSGSWSIAGILSLFVSVKFFIILKWVLCILLICSNHWCNAVWEPLSPLLNGWRACGCSEKKKKKEKKINLVRLTQA